MESQEFDGLSKYYRLTKLLEDRIEKGDFVPGDKIPSEVELCEEYSVSRVTVRQAVGALARKGLLKREQGKGTFVLPQRLRRDITYMYSFTRDMVALGLDPSSKVLEFSEKSASEEVASALELSGREEKVIVLRRIRFANLEPLLIENCRIPAALCPGLVSRTLRGGSLYRTLREDYGLDPKNARETYESIILSAASARLLHCPHERYQAGLSISRVARLEDGKPFEFTEAIGRADRLTLTVEMNSEVADIRRSFEL
jgi:GntR family transcriptional regulator